MAGHDLPDRLGAWVDEGLVSQDQADAIRAFEADAHHEGLPRWVEPVAYLGAALVAIALFLFGVEVWDRLADWGQLAVAAIVTLALAATAFALGRSQAAPALRASSVTWLVTLLGVAATTGLLLLEVLDVDEDWGILATAGVTLLVGVGVYLQSRKTPQLVGMAAASFFLLVSLMGLLTLSPAWLFGVLSFAVGLVWLLLAWGGLLTPVPSAYVIGSIFVTVIGSGSFEEQEGLWAALGIAVALGIVWLSTRLDLRSMLAIGVLGLVIWIPAAVTIFFEGSIAVPVSILITGIVTLTVVVLGARATRGGPADG